MSMSNYKSGLGNVGSYLVSGRPWLKTSTIADGAIEFYHLPKVTKQIVIRNDHQRAGHDLSVAFPEPRRAVNMPNGNFDFSTSFSQLGTLTLSFWFKFEGTISADVRLFNLTDASGNSKLRIQNRSHHKIRMILNNNGATVTDSGNVILDDTWHHLAVTMNRASPLAQVYFDGAALINNSGVAVNSDIFKLFLGSENTNHDGLYSDCTLFNTDLSAAEISALYNGVGNIDPRDHSKAANLVSWWAFEDNHFKNYFTTPDTGTTIFDRVGSNNLVIDSGAATFELGRHYVSIFNENRSHLLTGAEELTIDAKTTFMAVKCAGGSLDYSIQASLTGIDPERTQGTGLYD